MTSATQVRAHPTFARWLLVVAALATLALGLGARLSTAPAETTSQAAAQVSVTASEPVLASIGPAGAMGCWVTGDMVGEGNPVDVAGALCGRNP
jgi:hypothetical protein